MDDHRIKSAARKPATTGFFWLMLFIVFVAVPFVGYLIMPISPLGESATRSKVSRVQSDLRALSLAIETYYVEHRAYPAWAVGNDGENHLLSERNPSYGVPTFMIRSAERPKLATLTTPVAYMPAYPQDQFPPDWQYRIRTAYAYRVGGKYGEGFILYSPGPDLVYDIVPEEDYDPAQRAPSVSLINKTYDPTNGIKSRGDIYRVKQ
ncbi:hypothetical protein LLG95_04485 [bacterium]|nr:hypothetical protein [bacterium]